MRVSFDWDGCLKYSKQLLDLYFSITCYVYIVSSRKSDDDRNIDIVTFGRRNGLKQGDIYFTDDKLKTIQDLKIDLHFDDDPLTVAQINDANCGCTAVLVNYSTQDFLKEKEL